MTYQEEFDYEKMAKEAAQERDNLYKVLERRKANPPLGGEQEVIWRRENGILYKMYLEQRCNARDLARRARERKGGEVRGI